jgi:hypothetical protein
LRPESFGSELRRHLDPGHRGIFRDVTNLVDLNAGFTGECGFQLLSERGWFRVAAGKASHESCKLGLRKIWREVNACNSRAGKQLCETFFACGGAERHSVQQNLAPRSAKQEPAAGALIERTTELFPRSFKLRRRPHVAKFIKACELQ